jgi:hypothetical protein
MWYNKKYSDNSKYEVNFVNCIKSSIGRVVFQNLPKNIDTPNFFNSLETQLLPEPRDKININPKNQEKELTILCYMNAQYPDGLNTAIPESMFALERAGSNDEINIVAQLGRDKISPEIKNNTDFISVDYDWEGVRRYEVIKAEHPDYRTIQLDDLLKMSKAHPDNPILLNYIAKNYEKLGNKENFENYDKKANEKGIKEVLQNKESDFSKRIIKDYEDSIHELFLSRQDKSVYHSKMLEDLGVNASMKDPQQLENFIAMGLEKYPAKHHVIIFYGHGSSWRGALDMTPKEMSEAIEKGVAKANKKTKQEDKIDVVYMSSCMMSSSEFATQMRKASDISILSENTMTIQAYSNIEYIIKNAQSKLKDGKPFIAENFAKDITDFYKHLDKLGTDKNPKVNPRYFPCQTLVILNNKMLDKLLDSFKDFFETCKADNFNDGRFFKAAENASHIHWDASQDKCKISSPRQMRDFEDIIDKIIISDDTPESVKKSALKLKDEINRCIIDKYNAGRSYEGLKSFSLWVPGSYAEFKYELEKYKTINPEFAGKSGWLNFLESTSDRLPQNVKDQCNATLENIIELKSKINDAKTPQDKELLQKQFSEHFKKDMEKMNEAVNVSQFALISQEFTGSKQNVQGAR